MRTNLADITFTIFDTETTGLCPHEGDRIVELAALRIKNGAKVASFQTLVNPKRQISEAAFRVNQITPAMLEGAPAMATVMPEFMDFIKGTCLCSYNAAFDLDFLNHELLLLGANRIDDIVVVDVLKMARRLIPGLERYSLSFVTQALGIRSPQQHRAMSDVELTLELLSKFQAMLRQWDVIDYANFVSLFALQAHFLDDLTNDKIAEIQEAIDRGLRIKIKYLATHGASVTEREVIPKEIRREHGGIYLIGYCCLRNDERAFRIDGIVHMETV
jgi:DNA polymerase III epsilon subunit